MDDPSTELAPVECLSGDDATVSGDGGDERGGETAVDSGTRGHAMIKADVAGSEYEDDRQEMVDGLAPGQSESDQNVLCARATKADLDDVS